MGLDGVELLMATEEEFGILISDGEAAGMYTPQDLMEVVYKKLGLENGAAGVGGGEEITVQEHCRSQRAFHKIRSAISESTGTRRREIRLDACLNDIFAKPRRVKEWRRFRELSGLRMFSAPGAWLAFRPAPETVRGLVDRLVELSPKYLRVSGSWTREAVRDHVRAIISEQLAISEFDDDDEFVRDLGLD